MSCQARVKNVSVTSSGKRLVTVWVTKRDKRPSMPRLAVCPRAMTWAEVCGVAWGLSLRLVTDMPFS